MDENKAKKLQEIGFKILPVCGLCKYAAFSDYRWGTCEKHTYEHEKHTGPPRQVSVHFAGTCKDFEAANNAARLQKFEQFFQEKADQAAEKAKKS